MKNDAEKYQLIKEYTSKTYILNKNKKKTIYLKKNGILFIFSAKFKEHHCTVYFMPNNENEHHALLLCNRTHIF